MTNSALSAAFEKLFAAQAAFTELSLQRDGKRGSRLVALRRELQVAIADAEAAARDDPRLAANAELAADFRSRVGRVRTATARHQSTWPAVAADTYDEAYVESLKAVAAETADLRAWLDRALP